MTNRPPNGNMLDWGSLFVTKLHYLFAAVVVRRAREEFRPQDRDASGMELLFD